MNLKKIILASLVIIILLINFTTNIALAFDSIHENDTDDIKNNLNSNINQEKTNTVENDLNKIDENQYINNTEDKLTNLSNTKENENSIMPQNINEDDNNTEYKDNPNSNFYDKISTKEMDLILNQYPEIPNNKKNNIWIYPKDTEIMLNFINGHSSYTYSIDNQNYLICDNILRENENLDSIEPMETELDIALKQIRNSQCTLIFIQSYYYKFENNQLIKKDFDNNIYLKNYSCENKRVIILNNNYYNYENKITYNPDIQDSFIKALNNIQYKVEIGEITKNQNEINSRSSRLVKGNSKGHQTVWAGPNDNGTYATIGSVDDKEQVYVLGKEDDYYHIQYVVTVGSLAGKERSGYILRSNVDVSVADIVLIQEEKMTGGYRYSKQKTSVNSCDDFNISVSSDSSISSNEGVTLLYDYDYHNWTTGQSYRVAFIEFSTPNGMKRGYIKNEILENPFASKLIKSPEKIITYTGPDTSRFNLDTGAVGKNEYVSTIGYYNEYVFLEYNTNNGRRRAFAKETDLNVKSSNLGVTKLPDIIYNKTFISSKKQDVSAGPGACYTLCAYRGVVGAKEAVYEAANSNPVYNQLNYTFIVYHVGSSLKGGYVLSETLSPNKNPQFPDMPVYNEAAGEFRRKYIGQTGLGSPLYSYEIGNGKNKIYLCFNQHGWEDGAPSDGVELVQLALNFMNYVNKNRNNTGNSDMGNTTAIENINFKELLQRWTIYVIPSINRDGITSGYTNQGPGRTDVSTRIDMNRDWDTRYFKANTNINDGRNYTGPIPMGTASAKSVANYLQSESIKPTSEGKSLLLDIHGWDGEIVAWDEESKRMGNDYFYPNFYSDNLMGYSNSNRFRSRAKDNSTSAGGYIIRWAKEKLNVTNSMIVELPLKNDKTIDHEFVVNNNYNRRLTTSILNMMKNEYR